MSVPDIRFLVLRWRGGRGAVTPTSKPKLYISWDGSRSNPINYLWVTKSSFIQKWNQWNSNSICNIMSKIYFSSIPGKWSCRLFFNAKSKNIQKENNDIKIIFSLSSKMTTLLWAFKVNVGKTYTRYVTSHKSVQFTIQVAVMETVTPISELKNKLPRQSFYEGNLTLLSAGEIINILTG